MAIYTDEQKAMLRRVADHIETEPDTFKITSWINVDEWEIDQVAEHDEIDTADIPADTEWCGTTACIAGWAAVLGARDKDPQAFTKAVDWIETNANDTLRDLFGSPFFDTVGKQLLGRPAARSFMPDAWSSIAQYEDQDEDVEEHCHHCGSSYYESQSREYVRYLTVDNEDADAVALVLRTMADNDLDFEDAIIRLAEQGDPIVDVGDWEPA